MEYVYLPESVGHPLSWARTGARLAAAALLAAGLGLSFLSAPASGQSAADYQRWLRWCRSIGGTPSGSPSRPVCIPPSPGTGPGPSVPSGPSPEQLRREQGRAKHDAALKLWNSNRWDEVIRLIEEALALDRENQVYANNLKKARDIRNAILQREAFMRAFRAGKQAFDAGRWEEAIRNYEAALALDPKSEAAAYNVKLARERLAREIQQQFQERAVPGAVSDANRRLQEIISRPIGSRLPPTEGVRVFGDIQKLAELLKAEDLPALEHRERIQAALEILASGWVVGAPHAASAVQRDVLLRQVRSELKDLLHQALMTATLRMMDDVRRIEPFIWNPFGWEQRAAIAQMERELTDVRRRADVEVRGDATYADVVAGEFAGIQFRSGPAMRQLQDIHRTLSWHDQ